jgi:ATP-dependent Clp protease ATP-binding subunit ClpA
VPLSKQKGFERFSDEAIKALTFAKEEASRLGHSQIYSQFLLLGICDERLNKGAERLRKAGLSLDDLRLEVEHLTGYGDGDCSSDVVFGERALQAMQYAFDQVAAVGLELVRPEHLFVGIIVQDSGTVFDLLQKFNISVERLRENMALNLKKPTLDSVAASHLEKVRQLLCLAESEMDELFTMPAIDALVRAQSEAMTLLHSCFEPDHILLGLAGDKESTTAKALNISGIELHQLRSSAQHLDSKSSSKPQALKVSSQTKNALERAFDIAEQRKSTAIDSDHLLLSILEINACTELFRWGRLDLKRFKETVFELLGESRSELVLATESLEPFPLTAAPLQDNVSGLSGAVINAPVKVELSAEDMRAKHFDSSFTEVIKLAVLEAQRLGRNEVGTDHLQVGICAEGNTVAARALNAIGVTDTLLRLTNEEQFGKGTDHSSGDLPFSKNAALAIEKAFNKARAFGSDIVGADQLLLGILDLQKIVDCGSLNREDCSAVTILKTLGVDLFQLRKLLLEQTGALVGEAKLPAVVQPVRQAEISHFSPDALNRFANFSADSLKVVMVAQEATRVLGYSLIGSEQILLGLMYVDEGKTAAILKFLGLTPEILISLIDRFIGRELIPVVATVPYTLKAQQLFERARESSALVHGPVTTEHLLLSLLVDRQSLASIILEWVGADIAKLEEAVAEPIFNYQAAICKSSYQFRELDYEHVEDYWSLLEERFTANLRTVIAGAKADSCRRNKGVVDAPHLLFALVNLPTNSCAHYLQAINLDRFAVRDRLDKLIPGTNQDKISNFVEFDTLARQALLRAFRLSRFEGGGWVQTKHLLLALLEPQGQQHLSLMTAIGLRPDVLVGGSNLKSATHSEPAPADTLSQTALNQDALGVTATAERAMKLAADEAKQMGHNFVGTEQIMLGLIGAGDGVAGQLLLSHGLTLLELRQRVKEIIGEGPCVAGAELPFTPRTKRMLDLALNEAQRLKHDEIGTGHILLGLLREGHGVAARVLKEMGLSLNKLIEETEARLLEDGAKKTVSSSANDSVVSTGDFER